MTAFVRGGAVLTSRELAGKRDEALSSRRPRTTAATRRWPRMVAEVSTPVQSSSSSSTPSSSSSATRSATPEEMLKYQTSRRKLVEEALDLSVKAESAYTDRVCESMRYSLLAGGKRLRPILVLAAAEMFDGSLETAMPTAVAVEMLHTMSLIHDDLPAMDDDDFRRGKPTNHVVYGEPMAILAGDALLAHSFEYVAKETKGADPSNVLKVIAALGECVGAEGLVGGQAMDLECEGREDVTLEQLSWIHNNKTAALLRVSVACGAMLADASDEDIERVTNFANKIGLAFQIADDVLDVTQSSEELGKTAGKDEAVNKATYPRLMGLEASKAAAERLVAEAKECLAPYGEKAKYLLGLADFIVQRSN